ncbi:hypothetical protein P3X46_024595 [Hevea brasiliensis]|uniref:NB-ARC domain-containing protein n=1 Tax=Hevea brasiliensis TaxID=3981 RepID=A0ABQ9L320_HEVBR|nr:hypothetical protein P3X46_024595 [Hevea brasiliensis]
MALESMGALIGGILLKFYEEVRSLFGPPFDVMNEFVNCTDTNYQMMKGAAQILYGMRNDVLNKINKDKENEPTQQCQAWIDKVNQLEKAVKILESEYPTAEEKSFKERFEFSKVLEKMHDELQSCLDQGSKIQVSVERIPPIIRVPAPKIEDKSSLYTVFTKMTEYFEDENVERIGLWGTVGVGKTAIMKNLNNSEKANAFDIVIFATLPDEMNQENSKDEMNKGKLNCENEELKLKALELEKEKLRELKLKALELAKEKLRQEIAGRLKLKIEGMTKSEINFRISEELKDKKYLFLLDDVWDILDLGDIGICSNKKDSKVILASRKQNICWGMDIDAIEDLKPLPIKEAVALFKEKLGTKGKHLEFRGVAEPVVKHCSCLPLLIEKVAGFFKQKDSKNWRKLLEKFQTWDYYDVDGMVEVLNKFRFCFEELDREDKKLCFLYCALHTEGYEISTNHLVECCKAEKFILDVASGHLIVGDLIDASLLEKDEKKKCLKMNKVLRNMALKISSEWEDLKFLVKAAMGRGERISLMDNSHRLSSLPEKLNCINLSTLFLQRNLALTAIPDKFFESMQKLRVLDLHGTRVKKLPSPFCLEGLEVLYLSCCDQLLELPSEMILQNLEVLDIRGTGIYCLPIQIRQMKKLRCLRMSFSRYDVESGKEEEHQGVISNLSLLEELVIEVKAQNRWWNNVVKHITREVSRLTKLTSLSFCFHDVESFKSFVHNTELWQDPNFTFQFCVSQHDSTRCLKSANGENIDNAITISRLIVVSNDTFELIGHKGALSLSDFGIENINELKCCIIEGCNEILTVIDAHGTMEGVLTCLERIYISNVPMLESIWEGHVPDGSLAQLTVLCLSKCSKLTKIFSPAMIKQLSKLQHLQIEDCPEIEQIIVESENNGSERLELPSLTELVLQDLPKLTSIWKENQLSCPSLRAPKIINCDKLKSVLND